MIRLENNEKPLPKSTLEELLSIVADVFSVPIDSIKELNGKTEIRDARNAFSYLAKIHLCSYNEIKRFLNRADHTVIMANFKSCLDLKITNKEYEQKVKECEKRFLGNLTGSEELSGNKQTNLSITD